MAVVQSTYSDYPASGFPGMVSNGETSNRISRTVEDAAGIGPGVAAFRGTGDHGVTATPAASTFMGVTIADHGLATVQGGVAADVFPQYASVGLMNEGSIWVTVGANVTDGAAAYVTSAGVWTASSSGNTAVPAVFDDTVSSGGIARLRIVR